MTAPTGMAALAACLGGPAAGGLPPEVATVAAWRPHWQRNAEAGGSSFDLAVRGGLAADRLAWAFASGHQAAMRALLPALPPDQILCFCLTEPGGNRPRDLRTICQPQADGQFIVEGDKRWVTLGTACDAYLVMAVMAVVAAVPAMPEPAAAGHGGHATLTLLRINADAPGLQAALMPPTRFAPEMPHAELHLRGVQVGAHALLPGDGWAAYGKPFRTLEDIHITAAVLAWLLREGRAHAWPADYLQRTLALLLALRGLADQPVDAPAGHLALAGALAWAQQLYGEATALWTAGAADAAAQRWQRDAPLLSLASGVRVQRAARAWQRLAAQADGG